LPGAAIRGVVPPPSSWRDCARRPRVGRRRSSPRRAEECRERRRPLPLPERGAGRLACRLHAPSPHGRPKQAPRGSEHRASADRCGLAGRPLPRPRRPGRYFLTSGYRKLRFGFVSGINRSRYRTMLERLVPPRSQQRRRPWSKTGWFAFCGDRPRTTRSAPKSSQEEISGSPTPMSPYRLNSDRDPVRRRASSREGRNQSLRRVRSRPP